MGWVGGDHLGGKRGDRAIPQPFSIEKPVQGKVSWLGGDRLGEKRGDRAIPRPFSVEKLFKGKWVG